MSIHLPGVVINMIWNVCNGRCSVLPLRAQQLLLLRLRTMAMEQKNFKKKVVGLPISELLAARLMPVGSSL